MVTDSSSVTKGMNYDGVSWENRLQWVILDNSRTWNPIASCWDAMRSSNIFYAIFLQETFNLNLILRGQKEKSPDGGMFYK